MTKLAFAILMKRGETILPLSLFTIGLAIFSVVLLGSAQGATERPPGPKRKNATSWPLSIRPTEQQPTAVPPQLPEPADAQLIRTKEWNWDRYLPRALNLPNWLDLGLEHRTRFESYDHPWRSSQPLGQTDAQLQQRSRVRFGLNGGPFQFLFEGQDSRVHLDGPDAFVTTSSQNETDILQLFASATVKNLLGTGLRTDLHVGRLTLDVGSRRLIARNDFRNTTNAFDGVHWQLAHGLAWRIRAFLVEPVLREARQLDNQSARAVFWGTYVETSQIPWLRINAYYFGLNDQRSTTVTTQRTFSTFGLRLYEQPQQGQLDYEFETVWQTGTRGQTNHFAHFQHINLGYTFHLPWSPRILIHYDYASGDQRADDSQDAAFDTLFGARRFEYMPTGNFGPFFRTNISSPGWRVIVTPATGWTVQVKHRVWYLASSRGAFAGSGLRNATGGSGNVLGHDVELQAQWKVSHNLEFDAGYNHWFKGSFFDRLPASTALPLGGNIDNDYFYILTKFRI